MSVFALRSSGPPGTAHPAVVDRRLRGLVLIGLAALVPALVALAIAVAVPHPNLLITLALICGVLGVVALMLHPRIEITVALLALYMGLLDGPIRLGFGGGGTGSEGWSAVRDAFIFAIALGAVLRMVAKREPIKLPPLSGWVLALVALVMMEAFNPKTGGTLKILGGFRQQLEWVPFFFFGYAIMRSRERFRKFFLVLGVITLANGVVATYQTQISPAQLESWGPGYKARVLGVEHEVAEGAETKRSGPRVYISEGKARVRPMALGSDSGRGGGLGAIALPGALALLAAAAARRRWVGILLCLGAIVAVATSLARIQLVAAAVAVLAFVGLATIAGRRISRPLGALLAVIVLAVPLGIVFVQATGSGVFSRYELLASTDPTTNCKDCKRGALRHIPHQISVEPFGIGLGKIAAAGGFGGGRSELAELQKISPETQYSFLVDELGAPGLVLWVAFMVTLIALPVFRLRHIRDSELRIWLAAMAAPLIAMMIIGTSGLVSNSGTFGPYLWFAAGTFAYWLAGPGFARATAERPASVGSNPLGIPAVAGT